MSNPSRSHVSITLGRGAQLVKRSGLMVDSSFADSQPAVGSKRSIRDRLGSNVDLSLQVNKRMRGDGSTANAVDDIYLNRDDLRFKIMKKKIIKQKQSHKIEQNEIDLRNFLSRPAQSSTNSIVTREHMSKPKDTGLQYPELRYSRQHFQEPKDGRQLTSVTRDSRQHLPEARDQYVPNPRETRVPEAREVKHGMHDAIHQLYEPRISSITAHMPDSRTVNDVPTVDSVINSYSPWTMDRLRQRSPGEFLGSSRVLSPPRREEELQRRRPVRTYDDGRMSMYTSKDVFNFSSSMNSAPLMAKVVPSPGLSKTLTQMVAPLTLPGSDVKRSAYAVNDQLTVDSFLQSLDLEKYAIYFKAEEVDMYALRQMGDSDLKELGIPMGPRKKILLSLLPRSKRL
ncbi:bicaudal C homolog 1-like [Olea europaea subsp. europaea]|uniref:Bicaudal C homolog 1-like n=1 Tax=Olea europaea subsp. europaea TaxID=158383 RepID=A0A8S0T8V3_OLEEU|nr:bicaudal C homolog 1-like [Olea europaea subsp. europaea]